MSRGGNNKCSRNHTRFKTPVGCKLRVFTVCFTCLEGQRVNVFQGTKMMFLFSLARKLLLLSCRQYLYHSGYD